jgi:uncharacterized protein YciI
MRTKRVVVRVSAGPSWTSGPPEDQPDWDEHEVFVDRLVEEGTFVMGGPFADNSGSMSLLEGLTADEARELMQKDPFVANGVFVVEDIRDWTLYVDELTQR